VFDRLGSVDKTLLLYPPMRHEPLNELGREQVFADIEAWLRPRLDRREVGSAGGVGDLGGGGGKVGAVEDR
jgi:hypothetical protein